MPMTPREQAQLDAIRECNSYLSLAESAVDDQRIMRIVAKARGCLAPQLHWSAVIKAKVSGE